MQKNAVARFLKNPHMSRAEDSSLLVGADKTSNQEFMKGLKITGNFLDIRINDL